MDNSSQDIAERVKQRINNFKRSSVTEGKPCEVVMPAARSDVTLGDTIKHSSTWAALAGAAVGAMLSYGPQLLAFIPGPIGIGARIGMFLFNVADAGTAIASEKSLSERAADTVSDWIESFSADSHGKLVKGANSVLINNLPAAFATPPKGANQSVKCDDHTLQEIAQGSETVYIEGAPAARKGDKTSCGATISSGSPNVFFGSGQTTTQDIALETAEVINIVSSVVNVGLMIRNFAQIAKNIKCAITAFKDNKGVNRYIQSGAKLVDGDPIDVLSGQVVEQRTDFILGQTIPLSFTRTWARSKETDFADNCWVYTYNENGTLKSLTDGEGNVTHYDYDQGYRLIRLITTDDSYFYEYDKLGRITAIQSLYSRQTFDYDLNDRIIKETQNGNEIHRTYDDENQTLTRTLYVEGKDEPIITQFKYNSFGELIELNLPDTSGQKNQLFFQYNQNGNETDRTCPQGFILKQTYDAMDCLTQQRAGWEPTQFFDKDELRATGIDEPSFAEVNQRYRYDKALNTLETKDKGEQLYFTLNKNNQITAVHNPNREQERYAYDECGYLTQRYVGSETYGLIQNPHHPEFQAQRQIVQHQNIYQKGHKLYRLNENYYEYDKAGRLVTKVEKRDGFRKQETHYRWNGKNELIGITTPKGEVWHYKYDALGRRIAKECPQQHLRIEYLWDGDQLAYTQTFKKDELASERHSVFNGFELIAQQDNYQTLKQTIDGNIIEWKQETNYAICQPNGQVLALLNPQGKTLWRREKQTLWGLCFANEYKKPNPLDPQMLFAGQYFDEESGLAYNRFRYYDPETGNYISSDPIGLQGGETPYGYVHNPLSFIDQFGLSSCWSKKSRIKEALLPTKGKIRYIPPKGWQPSMPLPKKDGGYLDNFGNIWKKGPSRTAGEAFEWDVQLSKAGKDSIGWLTRDGSHANISLIGRVTHK